MEIKVPIEKDCNKKSFLKCSIDKEASSLIQDEKVEVITDLTSQGIKKERREGRRFIIGVICLALTIICSLTLFIFQRTNWERKIMIVEKEARNFNDSRYEDFLIDEEQTQIEGRKMYECHEDCKTLSINHPDCKFWYIIGSNGKCLLYSKCNFVAHGAELGFSEASNLCMPMTYMKDGIESYKRKSCNEASIYTRNKGSHCDGWKNISLDKCKEKCRRNEFILSSLLPATCPQTTKNCSYVIWDNNPDWPPGWCQLSDDSCENENPDEGSEKISKSSMDFVESKETLLDVVEPTEPIQRGQSYINDVRRSDMTSFSHSTTSSIQSMSTTDSSNAFSVKFTRNNGERIYCRITHERQAHMHDLQEYGTWLIKNHITVDDYPFMVNQCYELCKADHVCSGFSIYKDYACMFLMKKKTGNEMNVTSSYYMMKNCQKEPCNFQQNQMYSFSFHQIESKRTKEDCALDVKEYENATGMVWFYNEKCLYVQNGYILDSNRNNLIHHHFPYNHSDWNIDTSWACLFTEPPQATVILNEKGHVVSRLIIDDPEYSYHNNIELTYNLTESSFAPYMERSTLNLTCMVMGLGPTISIVWWLDDKKIDNGFEEISPRISRSTLLIKNLSRNYSNVEVKCIGTKDKMLGTSKEKISHSMGSTTIRMNLMPLKVELSYNGSTMMVNKEYKLTCRAYGSKPAAVITWWIDGNRIPKQNYITVHTSTLSNEKENGRNEITTSTLWFSPTIYENGENLRCQAAHPMIRHPSFWKLTDEKRLSIRENPAIHLSLFLGVHLYNGPHARLNDSDTVAKHASVTFVCNIIGAKPSPDYVIWRKDGREIDFLQPEYSTLYDFWSQNQYKNRTIHKHRNLYFRKYTRRQFYVDVGSLTIMDVHEENEGIYTCEAKNWIVTLKSNGVVLALD